jgi:dTMP kinase
MAVKKVICYHRPMPPKAFFVTFEGTDGVGKSTQARLTSQWLSSLGFSNTLTREPGGGPLSEQVRALLLDPKNAMQPLTELLLYQAARVEHINNVIRPALQQGVSVLCDRFTDATLAYQGHARGLLKEALTLNRLVCGPLRPDLTLLFDFPPKRALQKARARKTGGGDRLEQEGLGFQEKVRKGYLAVARREPQRVRVVRVRPTIDETQQDVQKILAPFFHGNYRTSARA